MLTDRLRSQMNVDMTAVGEADCVGGGRGTQMNVSDDRMNNGSKERVTNEYWPDPTVPRQRVRREKSQGPLVARKRFIRREGDVACAPRIMRNYERR